MTEITLRGSVSTTIAIDEEAIKSLEELAMKEFTAQILEAANSAAAKVQENLVSKVVLQEIKQEVRKAVDKAVKGIVKEEMNKIDLEKELGPIKTLALTELRSEIAETVSFVYGAYAQKEVKQTLYSELYRLAKKEISARVSCSDSDIKEIVQRIVEEMASGS